MLRKLRRWATLAPVDRAAVLEAWLLLLAVRPLVRRLRLPRVERWLGALPRRRRRPITAAPRAAPRLRRWVAAAAANQPLPARCLERALVLRAMLARRGHEAELRIGVRRRGGELEAHAWVEGDGVPLAGEAGEAGGYHALLPAAGGR